ncbi:UPF0182 family protein [Propionibacteriaceae bacterium Y1923]|uniref:UPF0182 family membrane protein n=1 Tax=Aestuariimicrobium sp. Y1814 TaxID=3418742 RepID=UPI003C18F83D
MSAFASFASRPSRPQPANSGRRVWRWVLLGLLALVAAFLLFSQLWTDWLWFRSLEMSSVYTTRLGTSIMLFFVFGLIMAAIVGFNAWLALRLRPKVRSRSESVMVARSRELIERRTWVAVAVPAAVTGVIAGLAAASQTWVYLAWRHGTSFGVADPWTGLDASFYVFDYPWLRFLASFLLTALVIATLMALALHFVVGALSSMTPRVLTGQGPVRPLASPFSPGAQTHLSILFALLLVVWAAQQLLDRYGYSIGGGGMFTGMGYTDHHARTTAKLIMVVIALLCAALFAINAKVRRWSLAGLSIVVMLVTSLVISGLYPAGLQQFVVRPSEQDREQPYIRANLEATRLAYSLDQVDIEEGYTAQTDVSAGQLKADAAALPAIRLMDPSMIGPTFEHLQQVRGYYSFPTVLDVDRYLIDAKTTDIVLAAREVDVNKISDQSWNNLHTVYTHGYGLVAAMGNQAQISGEPVWAAGGIPPTGPLPEHEPRIYFGELATQYVVVGAPEGTEPVEFDQPTGTQGDATKNTYNGKGGVAIGNPITRLSYAARFGDINLLLSNRVNSESKILYDRQPIQRVSQVAPWLTWDKDTYPAVVDGRVVWIVDGYTTTANFPNSQRTDLRTATSDAVSDQMRLQQERPINYIRNSVKGVVDALDGTVTLYAWDEDEPVLQTWMKVFPDVMESKSSIPAELLQHLRYPQDLFKVQRNMLTRYHTTNPLTWVQGSDVWEVPDDPVKAGGKEPPYYLSIKWPNDPEPIYSQTATFVPSGRQNLRAYMAVNADATSENYGRIRILQMDDTNQIAGPGQTMNAITTDPVVAERLRPFLNQGSATAMYGNLMTLPLGGGLLYVLPIYTERQVGTAGYPALQFVAVRFGEHVGIGETLQEALDTVFGGDSGAETDEETDTDPDADPDTDPPSDVDAEISRLLGEADASFTAADEALKAGDLATYQKHIADARAKVAAAIELQKQR